LRDFAKIGLFSGTERITISKTRLLKRIAQNLFSTKIQSIHHYVVVNSDGKYPKVKPGDIQEVDEVDKVC
jgi:hypothetical protein